MLRLTILRGSFSLFLLGAVFGSTPELQAQVVPGTGNILNYDDLEDANWGYTHNLPKSSKEEDENIRFPLGFSSNRMWSESPKRGSPDVIKRIETPAGGLPGSTGSLYLRTRDCGIPGHPGHKQAQDDFILAARPVSVSYSPNYVVRVFLPEFSAWEQRAGVSFGIRAGMQGMVTKDKPASLGRRLLRGSRMQKVTEVEPYYPGFFIGFNPKSSNPAFKEDHAVILIRSDGNGHEVAGPKITQTGWWTFGMSVTPDSRCHYYAHAGVADLTAADHIYSSLPYGIRGDYFNTIFFNVCSADNASSWSTPWIIDDPKVYYSGQPMIKPSAPQQPQQAQGQPAKTVQAPAGAPNAKNASMSKEVPAPVGQTPAAQTSTPPVAPGDETATPGVTTADVPAPDAPPADPMTQEPVAPPAGITLPAGLAPAATDPSLTPVHPLSTLDSPVTKDAPLEESAPATEPESDLIPLPPLD
jgi:hypothetical protein